MNKTKAVKDLLPGECFTLSSSRGSVYRCISVRTGSGRTVLDYVIDGTRYDARVVLAGLTTATLV